LICISFMPNDIDQFSYIYWPFVCHHLKSVSSAHLLIYWLDNLLFLVFKVFSSLYILTINPIRLIAGEDFLLFYRLTLHPCNYFTVQQLLIGCNPFSQFLMLFSELLECYSEIHCLCLYPEMFSCRSSKILGLT
jgi:hypothetical protein